MNEKIIGITKYGVEKSVGDATRIKLELVATRGYNPDHLTNEKWDDLFPGNVIVKCSYCGQWAAVKTTCKHCGGAV